MSITINVVADHETPATIDHDEPKVLRLVHERVPAWPEAENGPPWTQKHVTLSEALSTRHRCDAHTAGYSATELPHRLKKEALGRTPILMVAFFGDVDAHDLTGEALVTWKVEQWKRIAALNAAHPGLFAYETRGGLRFVYRVSFPLKDAHDVERWRRFAFGSLTYIEREFGIDLHDKCTTEWTRLFRLPNIIRDDERYEPTMLMGDPERVSAWTYEPTAEDLRDIDKAAASRARSRDDAEEHVIRDADFFVDLAVENELAWHYSGNKYTTVCPNEAQHTSAGDATSTTVWRGTHGFDCKHAHCKHLNKMAWESFVQGIPDDYSINRAEGWLDQVPANGTATRRQLWKGLRPGITPTRKHHDPAHRYSFVPGRDVSDFSKEPMKMMPVDIANKLSTHARWFGVLQYNEFARCIVAVDPPLRLDAEDEGAGLSEEDIAHIRMWLSVNAIKTNEQAGVRDAIRAAARQNRFHPVREWLESLPRFSREYLREHEDESPLYRMAKEGFRLDDATDPHGLGSTFLVKTLVGAVRRVLNPGVKMQTMLVLCGPQGYFKSTAFDVLFSPWFRDSMPDICSGRDVSMAFRGYWAVEFQEVDKWKGKEKGALKTVLTTDTERFRRVGKEDNLVEQRQCVLLGTTNVVEYMSDETGERRQWPVRITRPIDLAWLRANKAAIWADALTLALDPSFEHWLSADEEAQANELRADYQEHGRFYQDVVNYLRARKAKGETYVLNAASVYSAIYDHFPGTPPCNQADERAISRVLELLKCERGFKEINGVKTRVRSIPDSLVAAHLRVDPGTSGTALGAPGTALGAGAGNVEPVRMAKTGT